MLTNCSWSSKYATIDNSCKAYDSRVLDEILHTCVSTELYIMGKELKKLHHHLIHSAFLSFQNAGSFSIVPALARQDRSPL